MGVRRIRSMILLCAVGACIAVPATAPSTASALYIGCVYIGGTWGWYGAFCSAGGGGPYAIVYFPVYQKVNVCTYVNLPFGWGVGCASVAVNGPFMMYDPESTTTIKGGEYTFKGKAAGVTIETKCKKMSAKEPEIDGGSEAEHVQGKTTVAAFEYSECKVEKPSTCEVNSVGKAVGTIATGAVESELVESKEKKQENRFFPKSGTTFAELEIKGASCVLKGATLPLSGSMLTSVGPEDEEAVKLGFKSEPASKVYLNSEGKEATAELKIAGTAATLTGEALVEEKLDAFEYKGTEDPALEGVKVPEETMDLEDQ